MIQEEVKKFLTNDRINTVLFNEVPPIITIVALYLNHVDENIFEPKTARLCLVRNEWKTDSGETTYGYHKNPDDTKNKITDFLEQFENLERVWIEEETYCRTRYIGLFNDTEKRERLINKRKKLCAWYYNKNCMAYSGGWGTVTCHGNCRWIEDYEKELDEQ